MVRALMAALCALAVSGCIESREPILPEAQPVLGTQLKLQLYTLRKGYAREPERVSYTWNGALYAHAGGAMKDIPAFSLHPFEAGDFIIQTVSSRQTKPTEFALLHPLAQGLYLVIVIDEADADEATRAANCKHDGGAACRIETREQLFALARATAARKHDEGGLVIRLPDGSDQAERPAKRRR